MANAGIIAISMIVLVGVVAAVAVTMNRSSEKVSDNNKVSTSTKAAICQSAEYKTTCEDTVKHSNSSDPKELVKTSFKATMGKIKEAIKNSDTLKEATKDNMTRQAFDICGQLLQESIDSLKKSFDRVDKFDPKKMDEYMEDLKIWVSSVITDQTVCKDGFKNTTSDFGEKMTKFLESSRQFTVTGLDMIDQLNKLLKSLKVDGVTSRRLLWSDGLPSWINPRRRRLLGVSIQNLQPNVVVAKDGSGKYKTLSEALNEIPKNNEKPFVIHVKEGVYGEHVMFTKHMTNVVLYGDGPTKTRFTGNLNYAAGIQTFKTSTFSILGADFIAKDMGFENTAGPDGHQAVALRVQADKAIFYNCHMDGYQDTLYAQKFRQFYRDCTITGTVDFIFGDAAAVFQKCKMVVRKPGPGQKCMVTAQGRDARQEQTGYVLQDCEIVPEPALLEKAKDFTIYLGRPWKGFSRTVIIQSAIDGIIDPEGWAPWPGTNFMDTCYYAEFDNRGAGAPIDKRVAWKGYHKINGETAESFTSAKYLLGDTWIPQTGVPHFGGWMKV